MNLSLLLCKKKTLQLRDSSSNRTITLQRVLAVISRWKQNYMGRRQLSQLNHSQLKDIGVSRNEALEEAKKPFWKN